VVNTPAPGAVYHRQPTDDAHLSAAAATRRSLLQANGTNATAAGAATNKTYLYVIAGPSNPSPSQPDFLVTIDVNGPPGAAGFGKIVATTSLPNQYYGNEPHHVGVNGDVLSFGGLFSFRTDGWTGKAVSKKEATPDVYFFNISKANAASPT